MADSRKALILTFDQADRLLVMISDLFTVCGGVYSELNGTIEENIITALATRQFVIGIKDGQVQYFVSYWRVQQPHLPGLAERVKPPTLYRGGVMYVTEAANRAGRQGMNEIRRKLRAQAPWIDGITWHRPAKQDKFSSFPAKGGSNGIK